MFSQFSYPIICSDKFQETVAFYEDYFGFLPKLEAEGYVILEREGKKDVYLAIIDYEHSALPEAYKRPVQGMLLNYPVDSVVQFYDYAYHEGLKLLSEPKDSPCGRKHFYVEDPNGILIDVAENIEVSNGLTDEEGREIYVLS